MDTQKKFECKGKIPMDVARISNEDNFGSDCKEEVLGV